MCGRFTLTSSQEQIAAVLPGLIFDRPPAPRYNVAPTQEVAAVLNDEATKAAYIRWGLIPSWAKDPAIGNRMINARAETVHQKPSYQRPLKRQRCLVLADGFYEWQKVAGQSQKIPYYIYLKSGEPFAFAGLWDRWRGPDGDLVTSGTIITTTANELMADIHDRMPVILARETYDLWLAAGDQPAEQLLPHLAPYPAEAMACHPVSTLVNKPGNDSAECIAPAQ